MFIIRYLNGVSWCADVSRHMQQREVEDAVASHFDESFSQLCLKMREFCGLRHTWMKERRDMHRVAAVEREEYGDEILVTGCFEVKLNLHKVLHLLVS